MSNQQIEKKYDVWEFFLKSIIIFFLQINFYSKVQILRMLLYIFLNKILKNYNYSPGHCFLKSAARWAMLFEADSSNIKNSINCS